MAGYVSPFEFIRPFMGSPVEDISKGVQQGMQIRQLANQEEMMPIEKRIKLAQAAKAEEETARMQKAAELLHSFQGGAPGGLMATPESGGLDLGKALALKHYFGIDVTKPHINVVGRDVVQTPPLGGKPTVFPTGIPEKQEIKQIPIDDKGNVMTMRVGESGTMTPVMRSELGEQPQIPLRHPAEVPIVGNKFKETVTKDRALQLVGHTPDGVQGVPPFTPVWASTDPNAPGQFIMDPAGNRVPYAGAVRSKTENEDKVQMMQLFEQSIERGVDGKPTARALRAKSILDERLKYDVKVSGAREQVRKEAWEPEAQKVADAIEEGKQPPDLSGFGMARLAPHVRAILSERGFDLATASLDWLAVKKHMNTLNGAQQLRLRQAVTFAYDSLDIVEDLAKKWNGGPFPPLNKANLMLARNGAFGPEAQSLATKLDTQIADLTSELGTVYKSGNSSTDESLKLAATNLRGEWAYPQLLGNIDLVRQNLKIRKNSINTTQAAGVSQGSVYAPPPPTGEAVTPTPPSTGTGTWEDYKKRKGIK